MSDKRAFLSEPIAACGMNCLLCIAYQRKMKPCAGCRGSDEGKPTHCILCGLKICEDRPGSPEGFCGPACGKFPCRRLKDLDKRYRLKYGMSMLENLAAIQSEGLDGFLAAQNEKWTCKTCGDLLSVHREACQSCGNPNPYFPR